MQGIPIFNPKDILKLIKNTKKTNKNVVLGYAEIKKKRYKKNKNKPKIIFDKDHFLIYSSRNPHLLVQKIIIKDFIEEFGHIVI